MKTIIVIAGNMREFKHYCDGIAATLKKHKYSNGMLIGDDQGWIFLASSDQLRGLRDYSVVKYGTWMHRLDLHRIEELLNCAASAGDLKIKRATRRRGIDEPII